MEILNIVKFNWSLSNGLNAKLEKMEAQPLYKVHSSAAISSYKLIKIIARLKKRHQGSSISVRKRAVSRFDLLIRMLNEPLRKAE